MYVLSDLLIGPGLIVSDLISGSFQQVPTHEAPHIGRCRPYSHSFDHALISSNTGHSDSPFSVSE